jgi:hypothetical protein
MQSDSLKLNNDSSVSNYQKTPTIGTNWVVLQAAPPQVHKAHAHIASCSLYQNRLHEPISNLLCLSVNYLITLKCL